MMSNIFTKKMVLAGLVTFFTATPLFAADYQHSVDIDKMQFAWNVNGDQLAVKIAAPTTGWVAVGFNPTKMMKGANIIMGYVKDGKVEMKDQFGTGATRHSEDTTVGGKEDVTIVGGTEENGVTTLEFSIPMNSGDAQDGVIDPAADTKVIVAYGSGDSFKMRHVFTGEATINLTSGEKK